MPLFQFHFQNVSQIQDIPNKAEFYRWVRLSLDSFAEITLRLVDEIEGKNLNQAYRHQNKATNVLTFALTDVPHVIADIIICVPIVLQEAKAQQKPIFNHFAHLTIHGTLHAQGYNHETEATAELMESIEIETLKKLGISNPYT